MATIPWVPWSAAAFARARTEGKPVLLSIAPTWCRNSDDMDRTSYADAGVVAVVMTSFVPVRVDPDRRPDISARYGLGGWPTTAFLTPEGEILGGGTYVEADRLGDILHRVHGAFVARQHVAARPIHRPVPSATASPSSLDHLVQQVFVSFDRAHGGFGSSPKFPHTAPIRLALELYKAGGADSFREMAVTSLDAMGWGPLYDEQHGGFFRYASDADWRNPNEEKLLDVNASLLAAYVRAFEVLSLARYAERAEDILRYVQTWLADPVDAGWAGSQRADAAYYAADHRAAVGVAAPPVDRTLFTDWNAAMASAALDAGRVLNDPSLSEFAVRSLERVAVVAYRPGSGMAHYVDRDSDVRGLLDDQVAMAVASLDAFDATGNVVYEMMAHELALHTIRAMWDEEGGGFFDRVTDQAEDVGLLQERFKPFVGNCTAARMLRRLARGGKKADLVPYADRTLAAIAPVAGAQGPLAAEYVLAVRDAAE